MIILRVTLLLLSGLIAAAHPVVIGGKAPGCRNDTLYFYKSYSLITEDIHPMGLAAVEKDESFRLHLNLTSTCFISFQYGIYSIGIFAEPGMEYTLNLPPRKDKDTAEMLNPFFKPVPIRPVIISKKDAVTGMELSLKEDLNQQIASFDYLFDSLQTLYAPLIVRGIKLSFFDSVMQPLIQYSSTASHPYLRNYTRYRLYLLRSQMLRYSPARNWRDFFSQGTAAIENPAWQTLFSHCFYRCFNELSEGKTGEHFNALIRNDSGLVRLKSYLMKTFYSKNDTIIHLALIKGIYDAFYSSLFEKKQLLQLLDSLILSLSESFIKSTAVKISENLNRLMPGRPHPSFSLMDQHGHLLNSAELKGKYVYLNFCNSLNYTCLRDFMLLADYQQQFKNHLHIVTVFPDEPYAKMKSFTEQNNYTWHFVHAGLNPEILKLYRVKAMPTYYLIGPDGNMVTAPAPSPDERFEVYFFTLLRDAGLTLPDSNFKLLK